ncbi:transposase [Azospirillum thiophilum]|uniref:transposase n=1 Tax=Azospirillum thiophilum TaxID=528244 RepID=UPI0011875EAE|nr:transposase [Azospirillum thiophilum]
MKIGIPLAIDATPANMHDNKGIVHVLRRLAWVVERSFSWISRYRRLNAIVERTKEHLVAFGSILVRRPKGLAIQAVSA